MEGSYQNLHQFSKDCMEFSKYRDLPATDKFLFGTPLHRFISVETCTHTVMNLIICVLLEIFCAIVYARVYDTHINNNRNTNEITPIIAMENI